MRTSAPDSKLFVILITILLVYSLEEVKSSPLIEKECQIKVTDRFKPRQPLFLASDMKHILMPTDGSGIISVKHLETIGSCCPEFCEIMECLGGTKYQTLDGAELDILEDFTCDSNFEPHILHTNERCANKGKLLKVGFDLIIDGHKKFRRVYDVCYDMEMSNPIYVKHEFTKVSLKQQPSIDCPENWKYRGFFGGLNANTRYSKRVSFDNIRAQLNRAKAEKLIDVNSARHYLTRSHLAPKSDFVFAPKKLITCHLINAAPQFQSINIGNWSKLEDAIQDIVRKHNDFRLEIYTGTFGIFTVGDTPLYLMPGSPDRIPIPKAFYKIIHITNTDEYLVIVSVNNPYARRIEIENKSNGYIICNDICDKPDVKQKQYYMCNDKRKMNVSRKAEKLYIDAGYMYMCELNDFINGLRRFHNIHLNIQF